MTRRCAERVESLPRGRVRITVLAGGCGGFQYRFEEGGEAHSDDVLVEHGEGMHAAVVTDEASLDFLRGAVLDYKTDMMRSGFSVIENPIADAPCGCGVSFSLK